MLGKSLVAWWFSRLPTNVENQDPPEYLSDSGWNGLLRIGRFSGSDADPVHVRQLIIQGTARAYISVPAYSVPAMTNVFATPLMESANAPGSRQYLNPMGPGPTPPVLIQMARMKNAMSAKTLILSGSALMKMSDDFKEHLQ